MKIEHIALNVADPVAVADWYGRHFDLKIARHVPEPHQTHFLTDQHGMVLEIYRNPPDQVPDYRNQNPLILHAAFNSEDPDADCARLIEVGATKVEEVRPPDGSVLIMMRDPWGLAIQLCKRATPLVS